ncbi:adenylate/guanylate cyclase domain-containing protein [Azospirillum sp. SYSU D00513]|uniref:AAA family ATPase n=1 Tax=Azospirillum sp. SYSU D00513 TaxID=2812561 RepID=UPI001A9625BC|nr:adenylate/guanylate cyclase domain-containing protein [Azospirillum sp. SYSU D00513]
MMESLPAAGGSSGISRNGAERKLATVLFADIVDSSSLVAGLDPEDADEALHPVLKRLAECVTRYGGTVSQMLGDGLMAIFGAPSALEDHALRACLAARDMLADGGPGGTGRTPVRLRVGIASGEVLAQLEANDLWADYRATGECVHRAAKLQQKAEPGSALVTGETLDLIPVGVTVRPAGSHQLGASGPATPVFLLEAARAARRTAADLTGTTPLPFIGRERELALLTAGLWNAADSKGSAILLAGEAGVGKSRLAGELLRSPLATGFGLVQWPQTPIRGLGDPEELEAAALSLASLPADGGGSLGHGAVVAAARRTSGNLAAAALENLFEVEPTDPLWKGLDPEQRLGFAVEGLAAALHGLSGARPLLLLVEDAHWAGPLTVKLLNTLAERLAGSRVMLLATTRPETAGGWKPAANIPRLAIEPLDLPHSRRFLDAWLGSHPSLVPLKERLTAQSQGMPLYLEESLRALAASGALAGTPGEWRLADPLALPELPASVHALLAARIDSLDREARRALLTAAVIGPAFDAELLGRLMRATAETLGATLDRLERSGFITRIRLLPNLEYGFRHALIRDVAYATITRRERKALHVRVLAALCERREHDLPSRTDLMAHHAFLAEDWQAAYLYGRRAGQWAESRSRLLDAEANYGRALNAVERLEPTRRNLLRRIDLSIALPRALLPRGSTDVRAHLDRARDLAGECGDPVRYARSSSMLASFLWAFAELDDGVRLCREGLSALDRRDDHETRVQLLLRLGGILADKGLFADALDALRQGAVHIAGDRALRRYGLATMASVHAHSVIGRSLAELGRMPEAMDALSIAMDGADQSGHSFSKVFARAHLGWAYLIAGQPEPALPVFGEALALCGAIRSSLWKPFLLGGLGRATVAAGDSEGGLRCFERSLEVFRDNGSGRGGLHPRVSLPQVRIWHADALLARGRPDEALTAASEVLELAEGTAQLVYQARALGIMGRASIALGGSGGEGRLFLRRAQSLAQRLSMTALAEQCGKELSNRSATRLSATAR